MKLLRRLLVATLLLALVFGLLGLLLYGGYLVLLGWVGPDRESQLFEEFMVFLFVFILALLATLEIYSWFQYMFNMEEVYRTLSKREAKTLFFPFGQKTVFGDPNGRKKIRASAWWRLAYISLLSLMCRQSFIDAFHFVRHHDETPWLMTFGVLTVAGVMLGYRTAKKFLWDEPKTPKPVPNNPLMRFLNTEL